jgi:hypothetical protein
MPIGGNEKSEKPLIAETRDEQRNNRERLKPTKV